MEGKTKESERNNLHSKKVQDENLFTVKSRSMQFFQRTMSFGLQPLGNLEMPSFLLLDSLVTVSKLETLK